MIQKVIYTFNTISIRIPMMFFTETETKDSKICMEAQKTEYPNQSKAKRATLDVSQHLLQAIQQSLSNNNNNNKKTTKEKKPSRKLAHKPTCKPME
jgi:hypothetical protein